MNATYFEYQKGFEHLDLQTCVEYYQINRSSYLLNVILYKLKGTINYFLYQKTTHPDKAELLALYEDKLIDCLNNYDKSKGTLFITYYSTCLSNALINFYESLRGQDDLSLDYEYGHESDDRTPDSNLMSKITIEDLDLAKTEAEMLLEQLEPILDTNEYKVCRTILKENHILSQTEIAEEIGLTVPAIKNIYARLQKSFRRYGLCKNF